MNEPFQFIFKSVVDTHLRRLKGRFSPWDRHPPTRRDVKTTFRDLRRTEVTVYPRSDRLGSSSYTSLSPSLSRRVRTPLITGSPLLHVWLKDTRKSFHPIKLFTRNVRNVSVYRITVTLYVTTEFLVLFTISTMGSSLLWSMVYWICFCGRSLSPVLLPPGPRTGTPRVHDRLFCDVLR